MPGTWLKARKGKGLTRWDVLILIALFSVSLAVRYPNFSKLAPIDDEITYSNFAYSILAEGWDWPSRHMISAPPLFPYLLAVITYLFRGGMDVFRPVAIVFGSLCVVATYLLGRELFDRRVGTLAALLLAFSSFHIYYSRVVMLESFILFLATVCLLFFWRSQTEASVVPAVICGIFLGVADTTKYIALALYPTFILSAMLMWRRGWVPSFRAPLKRNFLVVMGVSILLFSPVLIDLYTNDVDPFTWQLQDRYQREYAFYKSAAEFGLRPLIEHGLSNYVGVITDSRSVAHSRWPLSTVFDFSAWALLFLTVAYSIYMFVRGDPRDAMLLVYFIVISVFVAVFATRFQYYLLWAYPVFLVMLARLAVDCAERLKVRGKKGVDLLVDGTAGAVIVLTVLLAISLIVTGSAAAFVNRSMKGGYSKNFEKIQLVYVDGDLVAGDDFLIMRYYSQRPEFREIAGENAIIPFLKVVRKLDKQFLEVNLDFLEIAKPRFIVTQAFLYFSYSTTHDRSYIRQRYNLVSEEDGVFLFERKEDLG